MLLGCWNLKLCDSAQASFVTAQGADKKRKKKVKAKNKTLQA